MSSSISSPLISPALMPMEGACASVAPSLAACMIPGPPPVTTAYPAWPAMRPKVRAMSKNFSPAAGLCEPNTETIGLGIPLSSSSPWVISLLTKSAVYLVLRYSLLIFISADYCPLKFFASQKVFQVRQILPVHDDHFQFHFLSELRCHRIKRQMQPGSPFVPHDFPKIRPRDIFDGCGILELPGIPVIDVINVA